MGRVMGRVMGGVVEILVIGMWTLRSALFQLSFYNFAS